MRACCNEIDGLPSCDRLFSIRFTTKLYTPRAAEHFSKGISIEYQSATVSLLELQTLPPTLTHLTFGWKYNQPLDRVTLPPKLTHLTFGLNFNQPLDNVTLPLKSTHLTFDVCFNQPLENVMLPSTFTHLTVAKRYNRLLDCLSPRVTVTRK